MELQKDDQVTLWYTQEPQETFVALKTISGWVNQRGSGDPSAEVRNQ